MQPFSSLSLSNPTPKQIPFKQIKPIKFMGINSTIPFNSIISDSKIIYFCGRSIILQNIKTYEQKPIWTNEFDEEPQVIQHIINIHRQNIVGIAIRDPSQNHLIIIMNINSQINNYQHLNKKEREKDRLHYLKNVPGESTTVQKLKFLHQGSLFAVVISRIDQKSSHPKHIFIYSSMSGQMLHNCEFTSQSPMIQGFQLNRQNYICIIKNEAEQNPTDSFFQSKKSFYNLKRKSSSGSISQQNSISFFTVSLINSSELTSKNDFLVQLNSGQFIVEVRFFQNHKKTFAILLLNSGFVLINMVNQRGFHDAIRIDVRIDKEKNLDTMKNQQKNMSFATEKTQQAEGEKSTQRKSRKDEEEQNDSIERLIRCQKGEDDKNVQENEKSCTKIKQKTLKVPTSKQRLSTVKPSTSTSTSPAQYYTPTCICCTNCKVIIGYEGCSFIGIIKYSAVDHRQFKFRYIFDFFSEKPYIESVRKINFSEDGCHCSVLVKVEPHRVDALMKRKNWLKKQNSNQKDNHAKSNQVSQDQSLKSSSNLGIKTKNKRIKLPNMKAKQTPKELAKSQKRAKIMKPTNGELPGPFQLKQHCMQELQKEHFAIMHIDFISGMIEHEYHSESIEQSLTTTSLKGIVQFVEFNEMNNTMLILMNDNRLYYYFVNPTNAQSEKQLLNCGKTNINVFRKKPQSNGMFGQKSINNYLSPESILLWVDKVKLKPLLILCHPFMFEIVLIFQDNLKFHFYNYDKIFENHHVLNLKNCKAASYSPFGDKLALGTFGSIWLVDSYTHTVIKKISLVIFPSEMKSFSKPHMKGSEEKSQNGTARRSESVVMSLSSKTVSRIQYINNDDLMIQTGNTTLSMLFNYEKVVYYGSTSEAIQGQLLCYDYKHRLGVIASQTSVKVITKCSINSKSKCEELAKIDLAITAMKLCGKIDILFMGGANGVLYFVRWPQFFQNDTVKAPNINNKLHLFNCPIVDIQISINYRQLFVMSKEGMMVICELVHSDEVQKIGKDVSFVMSKKIDLPLPLINKWLISTSDQEKRAQSITKLMGNEAEIKNNEVLLSQQYRAKLQKLSKIQKQQLEEQLRNEILQYEEQSGISKLQLQIVAVKDEIKRVTGKRDLETKKINEEIDEDLHNVFVEREKLEKQLRQLTLQTSQNRTQIVLQRNDQLSGYKILTQMQLSQNQNTNQLTKKMFENKMKIDRALEENMIEDFMDERYEVQKLYTQQLTDVYLKNTELNSLNRNKKVQISLITDKMRELSARMYELQNDCDQLESEQSKVKASKKTLSSQILETDKKYHALIKKTKQIQITLNKTRTSSEVCQLKYDDLQKQMELLHQRWGYLQQKREESEIDFVEQFKLRNFNLTQTQKVKQKIYQLKAKRKHSFQTNVMLKGLINPYEKEFNAISFSSADPEVIASIDSSMIEVKKNKTNKLTSDFDKWNTVKNDNKHKFIKYNQKMQQENNKLVYRFNQLQKEFKELVKMENHVKTQITTHKQKESINSTKWEKLSFVQKEEKSETDNKNKINSLSIHRQCPSKDNLRMTSCDFTKSKSLYRQISSIENLKKAGSMLKSILRQNENDNKLGKKGSKNIQALIQQKRQLFKQCKQNDFPLYHGVTLDKQTLKPKKTMCISLHQDGQDNGKFVTQY